MPRYGVLEDYEEPPLNYRSPEPSSIKTNNEPPKEEMHQHTRQGHKSLSEQRMEFTRFLEARRNDQKAGESGDQVLTSYESRVPLETELPSERHRIGDAKSNNLLEDTSGGDKGCKTAGSLLRNVIELQAEMNETMKNINILKNELHEFNSLMKVDRPL